VSCLLIQAFLAWDFCWAISPAPAAVSKTTLAPAMSINKVDVQTGFSFDAGGKEARDAEWEDTGELDSSQDPISANVVVPPPAGNGGFIGGVGTSTMPRIDPVLPPPPKSLLGEMLSYSNLRNSLMVYPFNKKKLEEELNAYGFTLLDSAIDRKLIAYLLETLELHNKQFVVILNSLNIVKIGFKYAITKDGNTRSLEIENGVLYLSPEFLNDRLAVRVSKLNDEVSTAFDAGVMEEYIDYEGQTKMASSEALGLSKAGDSMLNDMTKIAAEYINPPYWYGFKKFMPYQTDDPTEFMKLLRPKGSLEYAPAAIGVSLKILPDLIKLYTVAPTLWQELVEATLAHEGGRKGHLQLWPFSSLADILRYFKWPTLTKSAAQHLIQELVNEGRELRDDIITNYGLPAATQWLPAVAVFNMSLNKFGYDSTKPNPDGIVWKEYQADYGMVQEKGLRAVAIWYWWLSDYRGLNIDFKKDHDQVFSFLSDADWRTMFSLKVKIQQEYENIVNGKIEKQPAFPSGYRIGSTLIGVGVGLVTFILSSPLLFASTGAVQPAGETGVSWIISAAAVTSVAVLAWLWNKQPWRMTTEQQTIQLVNQAIRRPLTFRLFRASSQTDTGRVVSTVDLSRLTRFYQQASLPEKKVIIETAGAELLKRRNEVNVEHFNPFFLQALQHSAKYIQQIENSVRQARELRGADSRRSTAMMTAVVVRGLNNYNNKNREQAVSVNAVAHQLSNIVIDLALRNVLHDETSFAAAVEKDLTIASLISRDQLSAVYAEIIDALPQNSIQKLQLYMSLGLSKLKDRIALKGTSLRALSSQVRGLINEESLKTFEVSIDSVVLINGLALHIAYRESFIAAEQEITKLGIGTDPVTGRPKLSFAKHVAAALVPAILRSGISSGETAGVEQSLVLRRLQAGEDARGALGNDIERSVEPLQMASLDVLDNLMGTQSGAGTAILVDSLKIFLREEGTPITLVQKAQNIIENLLSQKTGVSAVVTVPRGKAADTAFPETGPVNRTRGLLGESGMRIILKRGSECYHPAMLYSLESAV
jgi:hypothetical protein